MSCAAVPVIARAALSGKWLYRPCKRPEAGKTLIFNLQPLALTYLEPKTPWNKLGSVIHQINETESCFMESTDIIGLQADARVVFSHFLSRETFFCFPFTFGVSDIAV